MPTPLAIDVIGPIEEHSGIGAMRQMSVKSPKPMVRDSAAGQGPAGNRLDDLRRAATVVGEGYSSTPAADQW